MLSTTQLKSNYETHLIVLKQIETYYEVIIEKLTTIEKNVTNNTELNGEQITLLGNTSKVILQKEDIEIQIQTILEQIYNFEVKLETQITLLNTFQSEFHEEAESPLEGTITEEEPEEEEEFEICTIEQCEELQYECQNEQSLSSQYLVKLRKQYQIQVIIEYLIQTRIALETQLAKTLQEKYIKYVNLVLVISQAMNGTTTCESELEAENGETIQDKYSEVITIIAQVQVLHVQTIQRITYFQQQYNTQTQQNIQLRTVLEKSGVKTKTIQKTLLTNIIIDIHQTIVVEIVKTILQIVNETLTLTQLTTIQKTPQPQPFVLLPAVQTENTEILQSVEYYNIEVEECEEIYLEYITQYEYLQSEP